MISIKPISGGDDCDDGDCDGGDGGGGGSTSSRLASLGQLMKYGTTKSVVRASSLQNHGFGQACLSVSMSVSLSLCLSVCLSVCLILFCR